MNHPQINSVRVYVTVWLVLLALTATTVAVSRLDLGRFNFIAAMTIAVAKGALVASFFMDLRRSSSMTKLFVGGGFFWFAILMIFILSDYISRNWLPVQHGL